MASASPLVQAMMNQAISDGLVGTDQAPGLYIGVLEDSMNHVLMQLSTDPLMSAADQAGFTAQLALSSGDII